MEVYLNKVKIVEPWNSIIFEPLSISFPHDTCFIGLVPLFGFRWSLPGGQSQISVISKLQMYCKLYANYQPVKFYNYDHT